MGVPLFSGFMYAAVGSYIARVIRIFDMRFAPYPAFPLTLCLAAAIYVNFFAHHFLPDIRLGLFAATLALYGRTRIWFRIHDAALVPDAAGAGGGPVRPLALWVAENIGTAHGHLAVFRPASAAQAGQPSPSSARGTCCFTWPSSP
jgi:uncharacterized membrane protein YoaT (DUF817 family)